jgi:AcrR family transcriptional regulator
MKTAQQARSRKTAARLLQAAEQVLEERGLEGASIPEIASRAGVAPASIYRRFSDKEGLLRAVFDRFFQEAATVNAAALQPEQWRSVSFEKAVAALVAGMVAGYSQRTGLLRAVITYGERHPSATLRRRAAELRERSVEGIAAVLLLHSKEIRHPEPRKAVRFGLQLVALALRDRILPRKVKDPAASFTNEELTVEFTRLMLGYLRSGDRVP